MKKKLIYAAVVSALLAGCGGDDNKGDNTSSLDYALSGASGIRPSVLAPRASDGTLKFSTETADLSNRYLPSPLWMVGQPPNPSSWYRRP